MTAENVNRNQTVDIIAFDGEISQILPLDIRFTRSFLKITFMKLKRIPLFS